MIFSPRAPDVTEHQVTTLEGPTHPVYASCDSLSFRGSPSKAPLLSDAMLTHRPVPNKLLFLSPQSMLSANDSAIAPSPIEASADPVAQETRRTDPPPLAISQ